ncbi:MAG TPA: NDP-hexose 2,3-dehydratase family protein [Geobacteraceae bacterium]
MEHANNQARLEDLHRALVDAQAVHSGDVLPLPGFDARTRADICISRTVRFARHDDAAVDAWIADRRGRPGLDVRVIPLDRVKRWHIDAATGNIAHETGRFFTLTGLRVRHRREGEELEWDQPIIDQPEVGILGILAKRLDGVLHFCLQAKEEPGNIGGVQLSPTVQATYSNYSRAHGGALPSFVELFLAPPRENILYARLQTEDGGRFLYKSNRNMIVRLDDAAAEDLPSEFIWLTLRQIARCLRQDNLVNACTRSVLSALL